MDKELIDYVLEIDSLSTTEFCKQQALAEPSWKGNISTAINEFLRIDAIKWRLVKDKAKEISRRK